VTQKKAKRRTAKAPPAETWWQRLIRATLAPFLTISFVAGALWIYTGNQREVWQEIVRLNGRCDVLTVSKLEAAEFALAKQKIDDVANNRVLAAINAGLDQAAAAKGQALEQMLNDLLAKQVAASTQPDDSSKP
jgi:hypothetical protein